MWLTYLPCKMSSRVQISETVYKWDGHGSSPIIPALEGKRLGNLQGKLVIDTNYSGKL